MKTEKKQLGTISIMLNEREKNSQKLNLLLTKNSHLVMARLGVNVQPKCINNCIGIIILTVQGTEKEIDDLGKKINLIKNASAKVLFLTKE